jgi:hypothetical protein
MSKATEDALADLHGAVAVALTGAVQGGVMEDGTRVTASAAHIMAAITFLKNNNITADASSNAELGALAKALAEKRTKGKQSLNPAVLREVAEELDRDFKGDTGGMIQ